MKPFWLVWNVGGGTPTYRHNEYPAACNEAERLADAYPGERFVVLEAKTLRVVEHMTRVDFDAGASISDEIPF